MVWRPVRLPKQECPYGFTVEQLNEIFPTPNSKIRYYKFLEQNDLSHAICNGTGACKENHGAVYYYSTIQSYMKG